MVKLSACFYVKFQFAINALKVIGNIKFCVIKNSILLNGEFVFQSKIEESVVTKEFFGPGNIILPRV
jgi:hypothetical protein